MNNTNKKRIKDLFNIKAGGDLDGMLVEQECNDITPYPIYANSAINAGIYGYTNNYKYNKESITVTARGNLGVAFHRTKPFNAIGRLLILLARNKNINLKYINYILQNNQTVGNQTAIPQLTAPEFGNQIIEFFEDYKKQTQIANFLDQETSKIDRKISILEQKHEKLEEYKQSVIFETVTKGLNSNVPMKDSGIDWIGGIPKHWEVKRVKEFFSSLDKSDIPSGDSELDGIYDFYISGAKTKRINKINLQQTALLLPTGGTYMVHFPKNVPCAYSTDVLPLVTKFFLNIKYGFYFLNSNKEYFNQLYFAGTGIKHLQREEFFSSLITIPTKNEQEEIADYLDSICSKIDKKVEVIKKQIDLLKEYKQTIIYEAVTGKKDIL